MLILRVWVGRRVRNSIQLPNSSTSPPIQRLSRSTTEDQDLVVLPSVKENYIFTKPTFTTTLITVTFHHFLSSLPSCSAPIVKEHYIFTKHTHYFPGCSAPASEKSQTQQSVSFCWKTQRSSHQHDKKWP